MLESVVFTILGLLGGILSGLLPGLHLNTLSAMAIRLAPQNSFDIVLLIVAMNAMHSLTDFIPSVLIGAPSSQQYVATLPGHRLLLAGHGLRAIEWAILGGLFGTLCSIALIPFFFALASQLQGWFATMTIGMLTFTLILMVTSEQTRGKQLAAILVMILAGVLGSLALSRSVDPLFALVTGFFGIPTLLLSASTHTTLPPQQTTEESITLRQLAMPVVLGAMAGALVSFFPAIGPAQAAFLLSAWFIHSDTQYLALLGSLSAAGTVFSFTALVAIDKARTGSAVAIQELWTLSETDLSILIGVLLLTTAIAALTTRALARALLPHIPKLHSPMLATGIVLTLLGMVAFFHGYIGLLICATASAIGLSCPMLQIKRSHCMAFLLLPTLSYYIRL